MTSGNAYGSGVYFSEFPEYSMGYIHGATKLMICQVLQGKVYTCQGQQSGSGLQSGYDSHKSPDGKALIIFNTHAILPSYIVHYGPAMGDFSYT